jgi:phage/plasmid-associated DNA primase
MQLLDEKQQDKRLTNPDFWRASGELPGIFNWALLGLARLRQQGAFTTANAGEQRKLRYRQEANPAGEFLRDTCTLMAGAQTGCTDLYRAYREYASDHGYYALSSANFAQEVLRCFKGIEKTPNPVRMKDRRDRQRCWVGLKYTSLSGPVLPDFAA